MRDVIERGLAAKLEPRLVSELLDAHAEAKRSFYLSGLRLAEVEGGRFCRAAPGRSVCRSLLAPRS